MMTGWRNVWIFRRKNREGYFMGWIDDAGRQRARKVGPDKRVAERLAKEFEIALNTGNVKESKESTVREFADEHLRLIRDQVREATWKEERSVLDALVAFCGETTKLRGVSSNVAEEFIADRLKQVAEATVNKNLRTLKAIFARAIDRNYLTDNPFGKLSPVKEGPRDVRVLTTEEIGKLLAACRSPWWRTFIAVGLTTGMRRGELLYLEWSDLDFDKRQVIVRSKAEHQTKSGENRVLPLVPEIAGMLMDHRTRVTGRWVFPNPEGNPHGNTIIRTFKGIVKKAGIAECTIHDLRRTFLSHLAMSGVGQAVTQQLAGHSDMGTTLEYYTHILPEPLKQAPTRLPFLRVLSLPYPDQRMPKRQMAS